MISALPIVLFGSIIQTKKEAEKVYLGSVYGKTVEQLEKVFGKGTPLEAPGKNVTSTVFTFKKGAVSKLTVSVDEDAPGTPNTVNAILYRFSGRDFRKAKDSIALKGDLTFGQSNVLEDGTRVTLIQGVTGNLSELGYIWSEHKDGSSSFWIGHKKNRSQIVDSFELN